MTFKRKFTVKKQLSGPKLFKKWEEYNVGDIIIGEYVGVHEDETYGKTHRKIKVEDIYLKKGKSEDFVGKILVLNSAGFIDAAFAQIQEGEFVQIEYGGKAAMTKGKYAGKEAHTGIVNVIEMEESDEMVEDEDL